MTGKIDPLSILQQERRNVASSLPPKLIEDVYGVEERVQFDEDRHEAAAKIRRIVEALLDSEALTDKADGNEV